MSTVFSSDNPLFESLMFIKKLFWEKAHTIVCQDLSAAGIGKRENYGRIVLQNTYNMRTMNTTTTVAYKNYKIVCFYIKWKDREKKEKFWLKFSLWRRSFPPWRMAVWADRPPIVRKLTKSYLCAFSQKNYQKEKTLTKSHSRHHESLSKKTNSWM